MQPRLTSFIIISLALAGHVSADCFCGDITDRNTILGFPASSSHLPSHVSAHFDALVRRFNAFGIREPTQSIPLRVSRARALDFRHLASHLEIVLLYSLNGLIYFQLTIQTVRQSEDETLIGLDLLEIIQPDLPVKVGRPTHATLAPSPGNARLEASMCRFFTAFLEALIVRQLNFSFLSLIAPSLYDTDTNSLACAGRTLEYTYNAPRHAISRLLRSLSSHKGRVLAHGVHYEGTFKQLIDLELQKESLLSDLVHLQERITQRMQVLEKVQFSARNSDVARVEQRLADQLVAKHVEVKAGLTRVIKTEKDIVQRVLDDLARSLSPQAVNDRAMWVRVSKELEKGTFLSSYAPSVHFARSSAAPREELADFIDDFVQRDVQFADAAQFGNALKDTREAILSPSRGSTTTESQDVRERVRSSLLAAERQLQEAAQLPDFGRAADLIAASERDSIKFEEDAELQFFRQEALGELSTRLRDFEKPVNSLGQPAVVRNGVLDLDPEYNGMPEVHTASQQSSQVDFLSLDGMFAGMDYREVINDARAASQSRTNLDQQPCDRVFEARPLFAFDGYQSGQAVKVRPVTPLAELMREKRVNIGEDIKLKVIFDSQWTERVEGWAEGGFQGSVVRRVNLMNERLPQNDKKLQEMQDWLINVVTLVEGSQRLRALGPHIQVYSDYSFHLRFQQRDRETSMRMLTQFMPAEALSEVEVQVAMEGVREAHFLLLDGRRMRLAERVRTIDDQEALEREVDAINEQSGF